jgi:uncharacterized protein
MMNEEVTPVQVKAVLPMEQSCALFLGTSKKTFTIYISEAGGQAISMALRGIQTDRPLSHVLMASVLKSFGAALERVVINDVHGSIFYARVILTAENELHARKVIELDARPSDAIVLALHMNAPILVAKRVLQSVEDMSAALEQVQEHGLDSVQFSPLSKAAAPAVSVEEVDAEEQASDSSEEDDDEDDDFDLDAFLDDPAPPSSPPPKKKR